MRAKHLPYAGEHISEVELAADFEDIAGQHCLSSSYVQSDVILHVHYLTGTYDGIPAATAAPLSAVDMLI